MSVKSFIEQDKPLFLIWEGVTINEKITMRALRQLRPASVSRIAKEVC